MRQNKAETQKTERKRETDRERNRKTHRIIEKEKNY
jgi:hypothetical protein